MRAWPVDLRGYRPAIRGGKGRHVAKESFILQMTRPGRLATNAVFTDERTARLETERVQQSGAFEHIMLVRMAGAEKRILFEFGKSGGGIKASVPRGGAQPVPGGKIPATTDQFIRRVSSRFTFLLIGGVIVYAVQFFMRK
jgi:hypothetical protein